MTTLFDANVLLAFAWSHHTHHESVSRWLVDREDKQWATCLLTQSAFLRLTINPQVLNVHVTAKEAIDLLKNLTADPTHQYFAELPPLTKKLFDRLASAVQGHRQVTDATLLHIAKFHGAKLATLDKGLPALANASQDVELIPTT